LFYARSDVPNTLQSFCKSGVLHFPSSLHLDAPPRSSALRLAHLAAPFAMQQTRGFDPAFPPTTAPFSPPLPTDHDGPSSTASPSSSHFLPIANGHSGGSSAGLERVGSIVSANGRLDKGKGVVREVSQEDAAAEEAARQRQVERVLKRAEAAKVRLYFSFERDKRAKRD
jgi:hypothetical protein